ncbi:hypothetical protein [Pseudolabrys taiwanensis]|nr:hypothetical protein [Pseudolabrys taiwanensis]
MFFHFSTVVWGPWHTGIFLDVNLPSLLADGNLPAFAAQHRVTYRIFTSEKDKARISSHPAFKKALEYVTFELIACPVEGSSDPIGMHHQLWRRSIQDARDAGAMILFVPPDVTWSNGAFRHVADLATSGKKAIFITYMRVVSETCVPEVRERYLARDGVTIDVSSRQLVEMAFQYIHPLTLTYLRESPNFPIHPEFILWRVPGEGYVMRVLVREMFAYDPRVVLLNEQALPAHELDPELTHFITDSDDLFALSFAPLMKDVDWFTSPQKLDAVTIGSWWLRYDSPANDTVSALYYRIHLGERTPELWRRIERQSDIVMSRLIGAREILRVMRAMPQDRMAMARRVVAAALVQTRVAQLVHYKDPVTIIVPSGAEMVRWLFDNGARYLKSGAENGLANLLLDHVIVGTVDLTVQEDRTFTTMRGNSRQLSWQRGVPHIDGVPLQTRPVLLEQDWGYLVGRHALMAEGVLPRVQPDAIDDPQPRLI